MLRQIILLVITVFPFTLLAQNGLTVHGKPSDITNVGMRFTNFVTAAPDNSIWIGLDNSEIEFNSGLLRYYNNSWTTYNHKNSGMPDAASYAIEFAPGNVIWLGTSAGLVKLDGSNWEVLNSSNSPLTSDSIFALKLINDILWVGTAAGLFRYDGSNWYNYSTANSRIAGNKIKAIEAAGATLWIGTTKGLSGFTGLQWQNYTVANSGLYKDYIFALKADSRGGLWIGTDSMWVQDRVYSGLYRLQNGIIQSVNEIYPTCYSNYLPKTVLSLGRTQEGNIVAAGLYGSFNEYSPIIEFTESDYNLYFLPDWTTSEKPAYQLKNTHIAIDGNNDIWFTDRYPNLFKLNKQHHTPSYQQYTDQENMKFLDVNNVRALISARGDNFWDLLQNPKYEVPKGTCKNSLFAGALWIGGLGAGGNLHAAAMTYRQQNKYDFYPGPLDTLTGTTNPATMNAYDKIWKINRLTIEDFILKFQDGSVTNGTYTVPDEILTWPAHGEGNISRNLAPFVDVNNDGKYDPYDGDYPKIKGDQMLYTIFNDNGGPHTETGADAMGIEVHASSYAFVCPDFNGSSFDSIINYTTFYNYRIINRSTNSYDSTFIGLWVDVDLGSGLDDYFGSNPAKDAAAVYNGSNYDPGWNGYGHNPPMVNYQILRGPEYSPGQYRGMSYATSANSGFGINPPPDPIHYYYQLTGRWKNGNPITYGGSGYGGTQPTRYMYPGMPYDSAGWSEVTTGNKPGDRRFLISSGPFNFPAKGETSIDHAIVFTSVPNATDYYREIFTVNDAALDKVKNWYLNNNFPSCMVATGIANKNSRLNLSVYPNPTGSSVLINYSPISARAEYKIYSINGKVVKKGKILQKTTEENLSELSAGIYIVKVLDGNNILYGKIVKQ